MKLEPDQIIDNRYIVIEPMGHGGMGAVWKAKDTKTHDSLVVIKTPLRFRDPEILKRFAQEAAAMRKYAGDCVNILDIQDVGNIPVDKLDTVPYYVTRFQTGGTLEDWQCPVDQHGNPKWTPQSLEWMSGIAKAIDFLHQQPKPVFHRDIKPANILFNASGTPLLSDFGIVKDIQRTTNSFSGTANWGTLAYMPPEVLEGEPFGITSDQYSFAATVYEKIAGRRPFEGDTPMAMARSLLKGHQPLIEIVPAIGKTASQAMDRGLSQVAAKRFPSCGDFVRTFTTGLGEVGPAAIEEETTALDLKRYRDVLNQQELAAGGKVNRESSQSFGKPNAGEVGKLFPAPTPRQPQTVNSSGANSASKKLLIGVGSLLTLGLLLSVLFLSGTFDGFAKPKTVTSNSQEPKKETNSESQPMADSDSDTAKQTVAVEPSSKEPSEEAWAGDQLLTSGSGAEKQPTPLRHELGPIVEIFSPTESELKLKYSNKLKLVVGFKPREGSKEAIGAVGLRINDRPSPDHYHPLSPKELADQKYEFEVTLRPGRQTIQAEVFMRNSKSSHISNRKITANFESILAQKVPGRKLFFLGVGIDNYKKHDRGRTYQQLSFCRSDVKAIGEAFKKGAKEAYHEAPEIEVLPDLKSKEEFFERLKAMLKDEKGKQEFGVTDTLVVMWSGHGDTTNEGQFRLVLPECEIPTTVDDRSLRKEGLSTTEMLKGLRDLAGSGNVILMLDSSYSGGFVDEYKTSQAKFAIDASDDDLGFMVIAATESRESADLGMSNFSFLLQHGLLGLKQFERKNKSQTFLESSVREFDAGRVVTAESLIEFLKKNIGLLSNAQTIQTNGTGNANVILTKID